MTRFVIWRPLDQIRKSNFKPKVTIYYWCMVLIDICF